MDLQKPPAEVSVIIPCFNGEPFLASCIESVRRQCLAPREILVVDDRSTDASAHIAASMGTRVITNDGARGPGAARNVGLRAADGEFVAFLDADDQWTTQHLARLTAVLAASGASLACSGTAPLETFREGDRAEPPQPWETISIPGILRENLIPQSAMMASRQTLIAVGGYDESWRYSEDYELWLRLATQGHVMVRTTAVTCLRRTHATQASRAVGRMKQGAWDARLRHGLAAPSGPLADAERTARIAAMRDAFTYDLGDAWYLGHSVVKALLEQIAETQPEYRQAYVEFRKSRSPWVVARVAAWARVLIGRSRPATDL
ncbi:MAG: glycosyltransferase family 2 protein [Gemmatimonadaceae bacterium]|nr:glycosyltransferase family 2 protein [Gemmatimonadaceae bacterium]